MATKNDHVQLLAKYSLFRGQLPPTIIDSLWHGGFSASRNPFTLCYYAHYPSLHVSEEESREACEYLKLFGKTREEQARSYYLWAQTVPLPLWRYFMSLPLTYFTGIVADMVPPFAIAQLLIRLDLYRYFHNAVVLDLFAGVCGWLMAFMFLPSHYAPRRWIAVDIDKRRLQICMLISRDVGVDVQVVRRDLSKAYVVDADVVVGSPPCHEFSAATVSRRRRVEDGLALVKSYLESVVKISPRLALMEEAATTSEASKLLANLLAKYGFRYDFFDLRKYGAIQHRRRRLIAWRV